MLDLLKKAGLTVLALFLLAAILGLVVWGGNYLGSQTVSQDVKLPLLAIAGIIGLLAALALVAVAFAALNLTDPTQALGLPEGSVRAVIAICLVVLFAIITVSLYSSLSSGPIRTVAGLTTAERDAFAMDTTRMQIIATAADTVQGQARYTIHFRQLPGRASEDFAKQLLVLVGTLVTSVAGFYFGSRTATASEPSLARTRPVVTSVAPDTLASGAASTPVEIKGSNLTMVTEVELVRGPTRIRASDVTSAESVVKCKVTIPPQGPPDRGTSLLPMRRVGPVGWAGE